MGWSSANHKVVAGDAGAGALAADAEEDRRGGRVAEEGVEAVVALGEGAAVLRRAEENQERTTFGGTNFQYQQAEVFSGV